jgi:hypothetical protein
MKTYSKSYVRKNDNYAGKVEYYQAMLSNAVDALDMDKINFYASKLEYFLDRQVACSAKLDLSMAAESI